MKYIKTYKAGTPTGTALFSLDNVLISSEQDSIYLSSYDVIFRDRKDKNCYSLGFEKIHLRSEHQCEKVMEAIADFLQSDETLLSFCDGNLERILEH